MPNPTKLIIVGIDSISLRVLDQMIERPDRCDDGVAMGWQAESAG